MSERELLAEALHEVREESEHGPSIDPCWYCEDLAKSLAASPQFARLIAEAKAEAWDEYQMRLLGWANRTSAPHPAAVPNPYRAALDSAEPTQPEEGK